MNRSRFYFLVLYIALTSLLVPDRVYAFHDGVSGYCGGCHNLTGNSQSNASNHMLKGSDASSTCLKCHAQKNEYYNILSDDGSSYTAGGDFYWLGKTFSWNENGQQRQSTGNHHGHNIVAADYGMNPDAVLSMSPGGIYPSTALSCISCHDPHERSSSDGSPGDFRLLGGAGYQGPAESAGVIFQFAAPIAAADPSDWTETDARHTAYGSGMSEWCTNCHTNYLNSTTRGGAMHPTGNDVGLTGSYASNYNSYIRTGDFTGSPADAYLALVPFETGTHDASLLNPSSSQGPDENANVMCLTCHRAHASAFPHIGRWDFSPTFITDSHPHQGDMGVTGNDVLNSYYGRNLTAEFGEYQRQFCNKCHVND